MSSTNGSLKSNVNRSACLDIYDIFLFHLLLGIKSTIITCNSAKY